MKFLLTLYLTIASLCQPRFYSCKAHLSREKSRQTSVCSKVLLSHMIPFNSFLKAISTRKDYLFVIFKVLIWFNECHILKQLSFELIFAIEDYQMFSIFICENPKAAWRKFFLKHFRGKLTFSSNKTYDNTVLMWIIFVFVDFFRALLTLFLW